MEESVVGVGGSREEATAWLRGRPRDHAREHRDLGLQLGHRLLQIQYVAAKNDLGIANHDVLVLLPTLGVD